MDSKKVVVTFHNHNTNGMGGPSELTHNYLSASSWDIRDGLLWIYNEGDFLATYRDWKSVRWEELA